MKLRISAEYDYDFRCWRIAQMPQDTPLAADDNAVVVSLDEDEGLRLLDIQDEWQKMQDALQMHYETVAPKYYGKNCDQAKW